MVDIFSDGRMPILAVSRLHLIDLSSIEHKCLLSELFAFILRLHNFYVSDVCKLEQPCKKMPTSYKVLDSFDIFSTINLVYFCFQKVNYQRSNSIITQLYLFRVKFSTG